MNKPHKLVAAELDGGVDEVPAARRPRPAEPLREAVNVREAEGHRFGAVAPLVELPEAFGRRV